MTRNAININNDIKKLFTGSTLGKRVLQDLMLNNFVFTTTFDPRMDSHELAMREGRRQLVLGILEICRAPDPTGFNDDALDAAQARQAERDQYDPTK